MLSYISSIKNKLSLDANIVAISNVVQSLDGNIDSTLQDLNDIVCKLNEVYDNLEEAKNLSNLNLDDCKTEEDIKKYEASLDCERQNITSLNRMLGKTGNISIPEVISSHIGNIKNQLGNLVMQKLNNIESERLEKERFIAKRKSQNPLYIITDKKKVFEAKAKLLQLNSIKISNRKFEDNHNITKSLENFLGNHEESESLKEIENMLKQLQNLPASLNLTNADSTAAYSFEDMKLNDNLEDLLAQIEVQENSTQSQKTITQTSTFKKSLSKDMTKRDIDIELDEIVNYSKSINRNTTSNKEKEKLEIDVIE